MSAFSAQAPAPGRVRQNLIYWVSRGCLGTVVPILCTIISPSNRRAVYRAELGAAFLFVLCGAWVCVRLSGSCIGLHVVLLLMAAGLPAALFRVGLRP